MKCMWTVFVWGGLYFFSATMMYADELAEKEAAFLKAKQAGAQKSTTQPVQGAQKEAQKSGTSAAPAAQTAQEKAPAQKTPTSAPQKTPEQASPAVTSEQKSSESEQKVVTSESEKSSDAQNEEDSQESAEEGTLQVVNQNPISRISLDTIDLDAGGNWLNKRYWYEKAEELFGEIREGVVAVIDSRTAFYKEVSDIGKELDTFYDTFSFDQGQVDQVLKDAMQEIGLFRDQRGDLSEKERELKKSIQLEQKAIEQFGALLKNIHTIDQTVEDTFGKALEYIDSTRKYEAQAWDSFRAIGHELDDKKAEIEFYKMESYLKNIKQAQDYLQNKLLTYLKNDLIAKARAQMEAMKSSFKTLQDKNIDLVKILNGEYVKDIEVEKQRLKESAQKDAQEKAQKEVKKAKPVEPKWYEQYGESMEGFLHWIHNLLCIILDLLHQAWCFVAHYAKEFYCYVQCYMQ